jgi:hypothetical protein
VALSKQNLTNNMAKHRDILAVARCVTRRGLNSHYRSGMPLLSALESIFEDINLC